MKISKHAIERFRERTGCKSAVKAKASIQRLVTQAMPAAAARTKEGKVRLLPSDLRAKDGWVFVIKGGCVATCYFGVGNDEVLPMPQKEAA